MLSHLEILRDKEDYDRPVQFEQENRHKSGTVSDGHSVRVELGAWTRPKEQRHSGECRVLLVLASNAPGWSSSAGLQEEHWGMVRLVIANKEPDVSGVSLHLH
ncbi:hypothetical protein Tco_1417454 [Tanacetum coccineum]